MYCLDRPSGGSHPVFVKTFFQRTVSQRKSSSELLGHSVSMGFQEAGANIEKTINIYRVRSHVNHPTALYGANLAQALEKSQWHSSLCGRVLGLFQADKGCLGNL